MTKKSKCSFCGSEFSSKQLENFEHILLKSGIEDNVKICNQCIDQCIESIQEIQNELKIENNKEAIKDINPLLIKQELDKWIIGQEKAKRIMSTALYNHYKRINDVADKDDVVIEKSNIILVGPTGSGKTAIVKALAQDLDLPYTIEDVTNITSAGYVGRDVDEILRNLLTAANGDIEKAQKGIVFLDEADKLRRKGNTVSGQKDVNGEGVQQALLKMIEGGTFDLKKSKSPTETGTMKFDTTNVLFIIGGAFEGIDKHISRRLKSQDTSTSSVGFGAKIKTKDEVDFNELILQVKHADLMEFGMTPEILGRCPIVAPLEELSEEALVSILTEPKNALVKQFRKSFAKDNVELIIKEEALKAMAKEAKKRKTGARALRTLMEESLLEASFIAPSDKDITQVLLDENLDCTYEKTTNALCE